MIRQLILTLLPFLLPLVLYYIYFMYVNRLAHKQHIDLQKAFLKTAPWLILFGIGLVLMGITLSIWALTSGAEPGEIYHPPALENQQIAPGGFKEKQPQYLNNAQ